MFYVNMKLTYLVVNVTAFQHPGTSLLILHAYTLRKEQLYITINVGSQKAMIVMIKNVCASKDIFT